MISPRIKLTHNQMKLERANQIKAEKKLLWKIKEKNENDERSIKRNKQLELAKLEQSFLEELNKRKQKKDLTSQDQSQKRKKKKISKLEILPDEPINPPDSKEIASPNLWIKNKFPAGNRATDESRYSYKHDINYYLGHYCSCCEQDRRTTKQRIHDKLLEFGFNFSPKVSSNKSVQTIAKSEINQLSSDKSINALESVEIRKVQQKGLPMVLMPIKSQMFSVHIVSGVQNHAKKSRSDNNTPSKLSIITDSEPETNPSYHMFRDHEIETPRIPFPETSKSKIMKEYEKNTVKRYFTPVPSINKKLQIESIKISSQMKSIYNSIRLNSLDHKKYNLLGSK